MLLFKTRPTALHKKYSYVYISDDFHLRVEGTEYGSNIALVTNCHTEVYIDKYLSFGRLGSSDDVCLRSLARGNGVLYRLTKDDINEVLGDMPSMLLNAAMHKVSLL